MNIDFMGISEARWIGSGKVMSKDTSFIYSGSDKHEYGVGLMIKKEFDKCVLGFWAISDRVLLVKVSGKPFNLNFIIVYAPTAMLDDDKVDKFYEQVDQAMKQCKSQEVTIVMGDLNAKVGMERVGDIVGPYGLGELNDRGESWIQWCERKKLTICNTWFRHHPRRIWTWRKADGIT